MLWEVINLRSKTSRQKVGYFGAVVLMLLIGIVVRLNMLEKHFTHIDDVGVAWSILHLKDEMVNIDRECGEVFIKSLTICRYHWARQKAQELTAPTSKIGSMLQSQGLLEQARIGFFLFKAYNIVPLSWTYSPGQFYLTDLLIHPGMSYAQIKFWGRFPSFIFSIIAIAFLAYSLRFFESQTDAGGNAFLVSLVMATSLQSIIYSAQMESYAVGVFSVSALILMLGNLLNRVEIIPRVAWGAGVTVALLCACQYQVLLFVPGFLASLLIFGGFSGKNKIYSLVRGSVGFILVALPLVFYPLKSHLQNNAGINWNAGVNREFMIQSHDQGFLNLIYGLFGQIAHLPLVIQSMLSPVSESSPYAEIFKWMFLTLFFLGVVVSCFDKSKRSLLIFSLSALCIWLIFVMLGKLTFGPTRHSMVMIPLFVIFVAIGFSAIVRQFRQIYVRNGIFVVVSCLWLYIFIAGYSSVLMERFDRFDEVELNQIFKQHKVDIVIGEFANSPYFMPEVNQRSIVINDRQYLDVIDVNSDVAKIIDGKGMEVAVYGRSQLSNMDLQKIYESLAKKLQLPMYKNLLVLEKREVFSTVEVDWSSRTKNGANVFFLYVFKMTDE